MFSKVTDIKIIELLALHTPCDFLCSDMELEPLSQIGGWGTHIETGALHDLLVLSLLEHSLWLSIAQNLCIPCLGLVQQECVLLRLESLMLILLSSCLSVWRFASQNFTLIGMGHIRILGLWT